MWTIMVLQADCWLASWLAIVAIWLVQWASDCTRSISIYLRLYHYCRGSALLLLHSLSDSWFMIVLVARITKQQTSKNIDFDSPSQNLQRENIVLHYITRIMTAFLFYQSEAKVQCTKISQQQCCVANTEWTTTWLWCHVLLIFLSNTKMHQNTKAALAAV